MTRPSRMLTHDPPFSNADTLSGYAPGLTDEQLLANIQAKRRPQATRNQSKYLYVEFKSFKSFLIDETIIFYTIVCSNFTSGSI